MGVWPENSILIPPFEKFAIIYVFILLRSLNSFFKSYVVVLNCDKAIKKLKRACKCVLFKAHMPSTA